MAAIDTEKAIASAQALLKKTRKGLAIDQKEVAKLAETTIDLATALQAARDKKPFSVKPKPKADIGFWVVICAIGAFALVFGIWFFFRADLLQILSLL